jgi:hypothetical protein
VVVLTALIAPDEFRAEESTPLAIILTLRGVKDEFVRCSQRLGEVNAQAAFFGRLSDGSLRGCLGCPLAPRPAGRSLAG